MNHLKAGFIAALAVVLGACGGSSAKSDGNGNPRNASYFVTAAPGGDNTGLGNVFTGNSIWVSGSRSATVDPKYPCMNAVEICVPLTDAGTAQAAINDLCPSDDTPTGTWTFDFTLYANADCTAPAMPNMECAQVAGETLPSGVTTTNAVVCQTHNADKDVDVCVYDPVTGAGQDCLPIDQFPDADLDGVRDLWDLCPNDAGPASNQGCPVFAEFGYPTQFATQNTIIGQYLIAMQVQVADTGTVEKLGIIAPPFAAGTGFQLALYGDVPVAPPNVGTQPGTLLAQTATGTLVSGVNELAVTVPYDLTTPGTYWLAFVYDNNTYFYEGTTTAMTYNVPQVFGNALPGTYPWGDPPPWSRMENYVMNVYGIIKL